MHLLGIDDIPPILRLQALRAENSQMKAVNATLKTEIVRLNRSRALRLARAVRRLLGQNTM